MAGVSIRNFTRRPAPRLPYEGVVKALLPGWDVSLVFVGETRAKRLNMTLRDKSYVPNVLSYSPGEKSGEIIICPAIAARQAPDFELSPSRFLLLLFIHGCLHLKGHLHGATMERRERTLLARFAKAIVRTPKKTNEPPHRHRNRHRHVPGKAGGRRRNHR